MFLLMELVHYKSQKSIDELSASFIQIKVVKKYMSKKQLSHSILNQFQKYFYFHKNKPLRTEFYWQMFLTFTTFAAGAI